MSAAEEAVIEEMQSQSPPSIIEAIAALEEQKRGLEKQVKKLVEEIEKLQAEGLTALDKLGVVSLSTSDLTGDIVEDTVPNPEDWPALYKYIAENDAFYLLHKRISATVWKEMIAQGIEIPGVTPAKKRTFKVSINRKGSKAK